MSSRAKDLHLCIPVLKRYDLLFQLLCSLRESTVIPHTIHIIDNGMNMKSLLEAVSIVQTPTDLFMPSKPLGVAESWNRFIRTVPEERLIVNDDIVFGPYSIERLMSTSGDCIVAMKSNAFSCFLMRDSCVEKVGFFDETISPGYAYFEDCDYEERMQQAGIMFTDIVCGVTHVTSGTLSSYSKEEMSAHHRRFVIAQENFLKKWGRMPRGMERQR